MVTVFHYFASHAPAAKGSLGMDYQAMKKRTLTTDQACWYFSERSCDEDFEYGNLVLIFSSPRKVTSRVEIVIMGFCFFILGFFDCLCLAKGPK